MQDTKPGRPVAGAMVTVRAAGGHLTGNSKPEITGATDTLGHMQAIWQCPKPAATGYSFGLDVTTPDGRRVEVSSFDNSTR